MLTTENVYETVCYYRQGEELISPQSCTVNFQWEHPENGLDWQINTETGQVYHYRNLGTGIEMWDNSIKQWQPVKTTDWFPHQEGIICWDDVCADWQNIPLD